MPAISFEALRHIFTESEIGKAFDGYMVVVVKINQLAEFQVTGERGCFGRNAFHQVAVGNDRVDVVVDEREIRQIEFRGEVRCPHRHAHTVGKALAKRPGCNLDSGRQAVFRMARSLRAPLAKALNVIQRKIVAGQIEQRVEQHAAVTG